VKHLKKEKNTGGKKKECFVLFSKKSVGEKEKSAVQKKSHLEEDTVARKRLTEKNRVS